MATRFEAVIPQVDVNENTVSINSLAANMETLASDGQTHNIGQDTRFIAGVYTDQCGIYAWYIADASVSQAQSYYASFIAGYTFSHAPYAHSWTIS